MKNRTRTGAIVAVVALGAFALSPMSAEAARLITGKDIKNGSVTSVDTKNDNVKGKDVRDGSLTGADLKDGSVTAADIAPGTVVEGKPGPKGDTGADGPQGPAGPAGAPFTYTGAEWSIIDRNSIGNFVGALRAGPSSEAFGVSAAPPLGVGSLGLQTGSGTDKVAFGNQVDFAGNTLATVSTVKYDVYTTGENIAKAPSSVNLPGVAIELDPTGADATGPNYTSLVYISVAAPANVWSTQDASSAAQWYMTGAAGTASNCNQVTYCTLDQVQAFYPDAVIQTVAFSKGRDFAFSGAVDKLVLNEVTYDFEPTGVRQAG